VKGRGHPEMRPEPLLVSLHEGEVRDIRRTRCPSLGLDHGSTQVGARDAYTGHSATRPTKGRVRSLNKSKETSRQLNTCVRPQSSHVAQLPHPTYCLPLTRQSPSVPSVLLSLVVPSQYHLTVATSLVVLPHQACRR